MALPTLKSTEHEQMPERRHCDPPALWVFVILGSVVIHIVAFWMLRLLLMGGLFSLRPGKEIISVDLIAPNATSVAQATQGRSSAAIRNQRSINTRTKTSTQRINSQTSSASSRTNSPPTGTQQSSPRANSSQSSPRVNPSQNQSQGTSAQQKPPASNSSQNQQSGTQAPSTQPGGSTSSPPNSVPPTGASAGSNSSNSQQGGGFIAAIGALRQSAPGNEIPDEGRLAKPKSINRRFSSTAYLTPLGITLDQVLVLEVLVVIETNGQPKVESNFTKVLQGTLSVDKAEQLARQIIEQWQFEPTYMGGEPVPHPYYITLRINPISN